MDDMQTVAAETVQQDPAAIRKAIVAAKRKQALRGMGIGALWCIGGIAATLISQAMAQAGGTTFVFWGAVVFGGFRVITNAVAYFGAKA
ncbi:MAG TPA: hypothetical protein VG839_00240 [Asticcacaulis sp.]|nr:hypothetical protein [Asticcacaulis sp.]